MSRQKKDDTQPKCQNKEDSIALAIAGINKTYGDGSAIFQIDQVPGIEWFSSGCYSLNKALSGNYLQGYPRGRIIEIKGPECIDADTFINYEVRDKNGVRQNHKGGTIERLFNRFHKIQTQGKGSFQRKETIDSDFYAPSINTEGRIFQNRILNVIDAGTKECFEVQLLGGTSIIASMEHEFFTNNGFVKLRELQIGDTVYIHNGTPYTGRNLNRINRPELFLKYHPYASIKKVYDQITDKTYFYHRIAMSRAVYEAHINNLSLKEYKDRLDEGELSGLQFLLSDQHIHHIDEDPLNNTIENLQLISAEEHGRLHALERHNNLRYTIIPDTIISIVAVGNRCCYDLTMESPANNYVANGIVVHNSTGKSTIALHAVAEIQKLEEYVAYVDVEHALDLNYATKLGVNATKLIFSQPNSAEEALNIVDRFISSGAVSLIIVDSVAALVPQKELDGDVGESTMGLQARLMSQAMRKFAGKTYESNTTVIFINQIRNKFVMFGSPETTAGGLALSYYASQRLDIRKTGSTESEGEVASNLVKVKVIKSKVSNPFREAHFEIKFGEGIDTYKDLLSIAVEAGIIQKMGSWFSMGDNRLGQGEAKVSELLKNSPQLLEDIKLKLNG